MTKISSAPPYPTCSGYFSRSRSVCQWTNSLRDMNLVASKTGSPGVTPMTISARSSPSRPHHVWLSSTIYDPHTIQTTSLLSG